IPPGNYTLTAFWDWKPFEAAGNVHVSALADFKGAHVAEVSQNKLLAGSGKVAATLEGSDFEFTTKVDVEKLRDEFSVPTSVRFLLPKGLREGPQDQMEVQIDTNDLAPGDYALLISQQDGGSRPVNFRILPDPPRIANLPIVVNHGAAIQHFVLKGERLDLVSKLEAAGAVFRFDPAGSEPIATERSVTVELKAPPAPGTALPITAHLADRSEPLTFARGLEIAGPLPAIASFKLSMPVDLGIALGPGEFPAGSTLNALLDTRNLERTSTLRVGCGDASGDETVLRIGEQSGSSNLQQLSPDQLFLALDTAKVPAGCSLAAVIDNGRGGKSKPFTLARIVRVPRIDSFMLLDDPAPGAQRAYRLTGENLEMVAKTGWDENNGVDAPNLPAPVAGPGFRQTLDVTLPDPAPPQAMLFIWLRGDAHGRATKIAAPAAPPVVPPALPPVTPPQ
ncbi:MAG TPA: hypothetical protein VG297_24775, partial [Bryobacteraceae bacterium]|nr:hypothetical protein [Bryobacteraceae bacterium]